MSDMKKHLMLAAAALSAMTLEAKMPEPMRSQVSNNDAIEIFDSMDNFEQTYRDFTSNFAYDCYADGTKTFERRIWASYLGNENGPQQLKDIMKFTTLYYDIIERPSPRRLAMSEDNGLKSQRLVYVVAADSSRTPRIDLTKLRSSNSEVFVYETTPDYFSIFQYLTSEPASTPAGAANLSALDNRIGELAAFPRAASTAASFSEQTRASGALRTQSDLYEMSNSTSGTLYSIKPERLTGDWIDLYNLFYDHIGKNENISMTYDRNSRFVSLQDLAAKRIIAACYDHGIIYIFDGTYTSDTPYLPTDWKNYAPALSK